MTLRQTGIILQGHYHYRTGDRLPVLNHFTGQITCLDMPRHTILLDTNCTSFSGIGRKTIQVIVCCAGMQAVRERGSSSGVTGYQVTRASIL